MFNLLRELFIEERLQASAPSPPQTPPAREDNEEEREKSIKLWKQKGYGFGKYIGEKGNIK